MNAWFYILFSPLLDRYYLGHTSETPEERLRKHLTMRGHWTSRARDWRIMLAEPHPNKSAAYARERQVKAWKSRSRIEALIQSAQ